MNWAARGRALRGRGGLGITAGVAGTQRDVSRWGRQAAALIASVQGDELRDDLRLRFDERAGLCEVDGRLTRAEAERIAYDGLVAAVERLRRG
jgi:hypothetical protein